MTMTATTEYRLDRFALETPCEECKDEQVFREGNSWFECTMCSGTVYRLTELGRQIAAMVCRHIRVNPDDERRDKGLYVATRWD
jgi:ribosomal protein S27E